MKIRLESEKAKDKKGNFLKDENGNYRYKKNEVLVLREILRILDTRKFSFQEIRTISKIFEKIDALDIEGGEVDLSLDEAKLLKDICEKANEKIIDTARIPLSYFPSLYSVYDKLNQ